LQDGLKSCIDGLLHCHGHQGDDDNVLQGENVTTNCEEPAQQRHDA
jgi:hypothetical protein